MIYVRVQASGFRVRGIVPGDFCWCRPAPPVLLSLWARFHVPEGALALLFCRVWLSLWFSPFHYSRISSIGLGEKKMCPSTGLLHHCLHHLL